MIICYISFGSNRGDRSRNIAKVLDLIKNHFTILNISSFYESEPVYTNQTRNFLNGVIKVETEMTAKETAETVKKIEYQGGRINMERDADKIIDLDLLYYGNKAIEQPPVIIPHFVAHQRKYILTAMAEIDSEFIHPVTKKNQKQMLDELNSPKSVVKL
tara:strand:- start:121 stop:597 length:477 start_codon:yes stop_codon:yes gene_type:complete